MEKVTFRCSICNLALTYPLSLLNNTLLLVEEDGKDHVPVGYYWIEDGQYYTQAVGQYLVNFHDVFNTQHHTDTERLNGCCGLDGLDGRNTVCANGHEIGTERSDCWIAHSLALDSQMVKITAD